MAIINATGPGSIPKVPLGKPVKLGSYTTGTDGLQFSLSGGASGVGQTMGSLIFQFIANGTVTALTVDLQMSLDGGTTFTAQSGNIGGATMASTTSGMTITALAANNSKLINVQIPNAAAQISFVLQVTGTFTLGTATKIDVWVHCG